MSSTFGLIARTLVALAVVLFTAQSAIAQKVDLNGKWRDHITGKIVTIVQRGKKVFMRSPDGTNMRGVIIRRKYQGSWPHYNRRMAQYCPRFASPQIKFELTLSADGTRLSGRFRNENIKIRRRGRGYRCWISHYYWEAFSYTRVGRPRPPIVAKPKPKPRPPLRALTTCTQCKAQLRQSIKEGFNAVNLSLLPNWVDESINDFKNCEPKTKSRVCRVGRILVRTIRSACGNFRRPQLRPKGYEACLKRAVP